MTHITFKKLLPTSLLLCCFSSFYVFSMDVYDLLVMQQPQNNNLLNAKNITSKVQTIKTKNDLIEAYKKHINNEVDCLTQEELCTAAFILVKNDRKNFGKIGLSFSPDKNQIYTETMYAIWLAAEEAANDDKSIIKAVYTPEEVVKLQKLHNETTKIENQINSMAMPSFVLGTIIATGTEVEHDIIDEGVEKLFGIALKKLAPGTTHNIALSKKLKDLEQKSIKIDDELNEDANYRDDLQKATTAKNKQSEEILNRFFKNKGNK